MFRPSRFFGKETAIDKAAALVWQAAGDGAKLVMFSESFFPTIPVRSTSEQARIVVRKRNASFQYYENSMTGNGPMPKGFPARSRITRYIRAWG